MTPRKLSTLFLAIATAAISGCVHAPGTTPPIAAIAPSALISPIEHAPVPTDQPYDCGPPVPVGTDITVATTAPLDEDVKAAVYNESAGVLQEFAHRLTTAGNDFQSTGNINAARCVTTLLYDAASRRAMDGYIADLNAWKEQNMALRAATLAFLKVDYVHPETPGQRNLIKQWMRSILDNERNDFSQDCPRKICAIDGHAGVGLAQATAAFAVATQNHGLFTWAMNRYRDTVQSIDNTGMIHADVRQHDALRYNLESTSGLVQLAEFGAANNIDLYAFDDGRLHLLVHMVARGLLDPGPFAEAAHLSQRMPKKLEPWEVDWAGPYIARFPEPVLTTLLQQAGPAAADIWAANPWDDIPNSSKPTPITTNP